MRIGGLVFAAIVAVALSACTAPVPVDGGASPTPEPSTSALPTTPTAVAASIPADCVTVVDAATYATVFGQTPLNDPAFGDATFLGALTPILPEAGTTAEETVRDATQLRCLWSYPDSDITSLQLEIGTVTPPFAAEFVATLPAAGYSCEETLGGTRCTLIGLDPTYNVETGDTVFKRDDVVLRVRQANFPTDNLLGAIVNRIWPA